MSINLNNVYEYVEKMFENDFDKVGKPYFEHCKRVAEKALGISKILGIEDTDFMESIVIIALSHDIIEDKEIVVEDLINIGYEFEDVDNIVMLSKLKTFNGTYQDKIDEICNSNKIKSIIIKIADNIDNSDPVRNDKLSDSEKGIIKRYNIAIDKLLNSLKKYIKNNEEEIVLKIKKERIERDEDKREIAKIGKEMLQELRMIRSIQKIV